MMSLYMQAPYTFHLKEIHQKLVRNIIGEVNILVNHVIQGFLRIGKDGVMAILLGFSSIF